MLWKAALCRRRAVLITSIEIWEQGGSYLEWRGSDIFFRDEGEGEPLLLIHGAPTASWVWRRVWPALAPRHRLIALDLLGFGLSDKPRERIGDPMWQADLCEALLEARGVGPHRLLAADYGATVAQELLARDRGERIRSLCLLNGGIFPEAHRPFPAQRFIQSAPGRPLARFVWRGAFRRSLAKLYGPRPAPDDETLEGLWRLLIHKGGRAAMPAMMAYGAARRRHRDRFVGALAEGRVPCRFVWGSADPVCGREMVEAWRRLVPGGDVVELPGVGHFPALEAPEALTEALLAFHRRTRP